MGQTLNTMAQQNPSKEELSMGQTLNTIAQQNHSKEELLHQLVLTTNVDAIKALCTQGVDLEWVDKEGKTALIVACVEAGLFNVAKTLIQLGANVNAYRPGRHAGTPLHHAAKRGLHQTVLLLLASGANTLVVNDEWLLALDVARTKRHTNVVRAIENHMCLFSGWPREFQGPGFLEALLRELLSRKVWDVLFLVVIIPCGSSKSMEPMRLELAICTTSQDARPRTIIPLSRAKIEEPKFNQSDPRITIFVESNSTKTRYRFAPSSNKEQLRRLYEACRGFQQRTEQTSAEALDLLMEISASIQSAALIDTGDSTETANTNSCGKYVHGESYSAASSHSEASSSVRVDSSKKEEHNSWGVWPFGWGVWPFSKKGRVDTQTNVPVAQTSSAIIPSATLLPGEGPIQYPSIDSSPVDSSAPMEEHATSATSNVTNETTNTNDQGNYVQWMVSSCRILKFSSVRIDNEVHNGWGVWPFGWSVWPFSKQGRVDTQTSVPVAQTSGATIPSAPPIPDEGPIQYPSIDSIPVDYSAPPEEHASSATSNVKNEGDSAPSCIICWEAPMGGACIPCGHMAGCMGCLSEIKAKKGVCPICRNKIDQVLKLYAV